VPSPVESGSAAASAPVELDQASADAPVEGSPKDGSAVAVGGGAEPVVAGVAEVLASRRRRRRAPLWAKLCAVLGVILTVGSGGLLVGSKILLARYESAVVTEKLLPDEAVDPSASTQPVVERGSDISGPLNILLVGIDQRPNEPNTLPRSDSIMILHIDAGLSSGYLASIPRDLRVNIPRFDKAQYWGGNDKINAAMAYGSRVPGQEKPSTAQGFELLAKTVSSYTGIKHFDAGAIISFTGFQKIVDAMGGVDLYVDMQVKSEHRQPNGALRAYNPYGSGYVGPQAVYEKGTHHLVGWQALDYVRQRYLAGGDYTRQRHQQQFIKAMISQAFGMNVVTNPVTLDRVLRAAGQALVFDGRGHSVVDYAFALKNLRANSIVAVKLPGYGLGVGSNYRGEELDPIAGQYFAALRSGQLDTFMAAHQELINK
jgi:LCP family protein required for cell wall assembly